MMEFPTRLGLQKISLDHVLRFPRGIIGYESKRDFALLRIREESPFLVLQSLEDPGLGLLVADPYSFVQDYSIRLNDVEQHMLHISSPEQVSVLVTVSIPAGRPEETCLNLMGPVVVNHEARLGLQVPQSDPDQPAKVFLHKK
ncbi:MAG: flagellar assembly protein FliW [Desulfovibrionaceae bacterium]|nr:flagellar assembly protein FliW [Desulfovibrionaceae bacterium]